MAYRPVNAKTWSFNNRISYSVTDEVYQKSENIYRGMRVAQALVALLTIPVTSAACSCAAVAYVQHNRHTHGMTMRQTKALADRGWTDPTTFVRVFSSYQGIRRTASLFLLIAMALNVIGGIISGLQQILLGTKSIKTPGGIGRTLYNLLDTPGQFANADEDDNQLTVLMTRNALTTAKSTEPVSQLWHGNNFDCATTEWSKDTSGTLISTCGYGATLNIYSWDQDPFLAELPSTFTSAVIRQSAPRFNVSARHEIVDSSL